MSYRNGRAEFEQQVVRVGGCDEWQGWLDKDGYGFMCFRGVKQRAHRLAWFFEHGEWPSEQVLHHCDNPSCVRPDHLFVGTQAVNMADMRAKGRGARGEKHGQARLTAAAVQEIRASRGKVKQRVLAERYGVCIPTICEVQTRRKWAHVPDAPLAAHES